MLRARIELTSSRPQRDILTTGRSEPNRPVKYFCSYMVINRCALHFVHKLRKKATCHYILTLGHPQRRHRNNTTASRLLQRLFFYCMHACMSAWVDGKMAHFAAFDFTHQLLLTLGHPQRHHRNNATTSCMEINNQHHRYGVHRGIAIIVVASTSCEHVIVEGSK